MTGPAIRGIRRGKVDGIDVIEICLPYSNHDSLLKRSLIFFRFAMRSVRIALSEPYDLLFATSTPLTAGIPGIVMRVLKHKRRFVFEVRDLWPAGPRSRKAIKNPLVLFGMSMLEKASYLAMDAGVGLSPGIQQGMRRRTAAHKRIEMIPNGCDLDLFRPPEDADMDGSELPPGFPTDGLRCVFTGAHGMANGLDAVLDAASELLRRGRTDIHLIFIGDGKLKPQLVARSEREQLTNCHFFDPVPKKLLAQVMNDTDVGLQILQNVPAFYYGTSPNKFFDYISCGLPVVVNYPGWMADLIQENACGLAVPPDDPARFADALIQLADDRDRLSDMGTNARQLAEREFDREMLTNRLVDFLEEVAEIEAPIPATHQVKQQPARKRKTETIQET